MKRLASLALVVTCLPLAACSSSSTASSSHTAQYCASARDFAHKNAVPGQKIGDPQAVKKAYQDIEKSADTLASQAPSPQLSQAWKSVAAFYSTMVSGKKMMNSTATTQQITQAVYDIGARCNITVPGMESMR